MHFSDKIGEASNEVFKMTIDIFIKEIRIKKGVSQKKLAEMTNIDKRRISIIEKNTEKTLLVEAILISKALNIEITELYQTGTLTIIG